MAVPELRTGDLVLSADGKDIGIVKELADTCFKVSAPKQRDFWLAIDAVKERSADVAVLRVDKNRLEDASINLQAHKGPHSHEKKQTPESQGTLVKPLLILAGAAIVAMRDEDRRRKVVSTARSGLERVRSRISRRKHTAVSTGNHEPMQSRWATGTVGSPQPPVRELSSREQAVVREVTLAFPSMNLVVAPVTVHKLDGSEAETLRFTLEEAASSDLELARLEKSPETEQVLAREVIEDLKMQLPPDLETAE